MRRGYIAIFLLLATLSASATTYYISPSGNDSNNGTSSGTPWLSPNHALNCGDVILAAAGTYDANNFNNTWGAVTCPAGNNVAWLKCTTFDTCKINATGSSENAMNVSADYWGVQGWEVTTSAAAGSCFLAYPTFGTVHHIIFANDIANGCGLGGVQATNDGTTASFDYVAFIGNIAYNSTQSSANCTSGINVYQPTEIDSLPGTHIYIAGNFSWGNVEPNPCRGGVPTDGSGIILDTIDNSQGGPTTPYAGQIVVDNNISLYNGGRGINVYRNTAGTLNANIYLRHNTLWGNNWDTNETGSIYCGESQLNLVYNVEEYDDLAVTNAATGCSGAALYGYWVHDANGTVHVYNDWAWSATGTYTQSASSPGFSFGPSVTTANPLLTDPTIPGAPSCSSYASVPACMATVIADFTPTNAAAKSYGYQPPSSTPDYDPLFPQWLCNVTNMPAGLVTPGCVVASALSCGSKR